MRFSPSSMTGQFLPTRISHSGRTNMPAADTLSAFNVCTRRLPSVRMRSDSPALRNAWSGVSK